MLTDRETYGLIFLGFIDLIIAYIYARNNAGLTDSGGTIFKHTLINFSVIVVIELIIYGLVVILTGANPLNLVLFGGDLISGAVSLIASLFKGLV